MAWPTMDASEIVIESDSHLAWHSVPASYENVHAVWLVSGWQVRHLPNVGVGSRWPRA